MPIDTARMVKVVNQALTKAEAQSDTGYGSKFDRLRLSAFIASRVMDELELSDVGISEVRVQQTTDPLDFDRQLKSIRETGQAAPVKESEPIPAPLPPKSMIVMPDDPEYAEALKQTEASRRGVPDGVITTGRRITRAASTGGAVITRYWTPEQVFREIRKNTPEEFYFKPDRMPEGTKVRAVRDWLNMPGMDMVRLIYKNPQVSGDSIDSSGMGPARVVIGLDAIHNLLLTQPEFDWKSIMDGILVKLKGLYAPRSKQMMGTDPGDPPIDSWNAFQDGMREQADIRRESNWGMVNNPQGSVVDRVVKQNRETGNAWKDVR